MNKNFRCSELKENLTEHLYGTALEVDHWFLLEYSGNWKKDTLESSNLSKEIKEHLTDLVESFNKSRLQFIKKDKSKNNNLMKFYYANSSEFNPKLYQFNLREIEDVLNFNIPDLVESGGISEFESDSKLVLVCTHSSYDFCCGKLGNSVYNQLNESGEFEVWKTTHVGGHRFATNLVLIPQGLYYGRVNFSNLEKLVEHLRDGRIYLECLRGRSCYNTLAQVSDYFLRDQTKKLGIHDFRWEFEKDRDAYTAVEFREEGKELVHSVNSIVLNDAIRIFPNCGDEMSKSIAQFYFYSLISYKPKPKEQS